MQVDKFCHACGTPRTGAHACPQCSAAPLQAPAPAEPQKPMSMMERAAAAAAEAKKQANRLANAMVTCRQCGAQAEAGDVNNKFCTQCGTCYPSAASAAACAAAGAINLAKSGMMYAADKLDTFAGKGSEQQVPQTAAIQPPQSVLPTPAPPPPEPIPVCPTCPECHGKGPTGCSFCPAAAKQAAAGQ